MSIHTQLSSHIPTINNQPSPPVVVVMGATGTGKSRLSIDLAAHFAPAEVINSDKMQVYQGLEITTNKITEQERRGVHHHLLRIADPDADFSAANFCDMASLSIQSIIGRGHLPIIVGGSNSFIEALVDDARFRLSQGRSHISYDFLFLWVDAAPPVHHAALSARVEDMVERGMLEEVREFFRPSGVDYTKGIRKSIGVPEFDRLFRVESSSDEETRKKIMAEAIDEIKMNTIRLACKQIEKIHRFRDEKGWNMHRLDSTEALMRHGGDAEEAWRELVVGPGVAAVKKILYDVEACTH